MDRERRSGERRLGGGGAALWMGLGALAGVAAAAAALAPAALALAGGLLGEGWQEGVLLAACLLGGLGAGALGSAPAGPRRLLRAAGAGLGMFLLLAAAGACWNQDFDPGPLSLAQGGCCLLGGALAGFARALSGGKKGEPSDFRGRNRRK